MSSTPNLKEGEIVWIGAKRHTDHPSPHNCRSEHKPKHSALARIWATRRHHRYSAHDLIEIRTRARHSEFCGIDERWNGTVRRKSEDYYGENYLAAQRKVQQFADEYNNVRLHAAPSYFEPREFHFGSPSQR